MADAEIQVHIGLGFDPEHREAAANLYWNAFGLKLEHALRPRERGIGLIEQGLDSARAITAFAGEELVGLAGFNLDGRALVELRGSEIIKEFGLWQGIRRTAWASLLHRRPASGVLMMDGIVVRPDWRGHGIGTKLLERLFEVASEHDKPVVRLDVVDTNPAAHRLYERMGFVQLENQKVPLMRRVMGFPAAKTMERKGK